MSPMAVEQNPHNKADVYKYDSVYRLTNFYRDCNYPYKPPPAPDGVLTQYQLDGVGNRDWVEVGGVRTDYEPNPLNQYTSVGGVEKCYDNNGNLTDDGGKLCYYDYKDRLVEVRKKSDNSLIAQYSYDCFGRRISSTVYYPGHYMMNYYYEGASLIEERVVGEDVQQYIYGSGIDEILVMIDRHGDKYYYHTNSLGSVTEITDYSGAVVERYTYDAYGKPSIFDANWNPRNYSFIDNRFMFTGREYDYETGFYYYRARYYDPSTGRFLQRDPKGYVDGMCLYEYVRGNPSNRRDPLGMQEEKPQAPAQPGKLNQDKERTNQQIEQELKEAKDSVREAEFQKAMALQDFKSKRDAGEYEDKEGTMKQMDDWNRIMEIEAKINELKGKCKDLEMELFRRQTQTEVTDREKDLQKQIEEKGAEADKKWADVQLTEKEIEDFKREFREIMNKFKEKTAWMRKIAEIVDKITFGVDPASSLSKLHGALLEGQGDVWEVIALRQAFHNLNQKVWEASTLSAEKTKLEEEKKAIEDERFKKWQERPQP
jgi:RHS repeat-associated protein